MSANPTNLLQISRSFREARVLLSAFELGIFEMTCGSGASALEISQSKDLDRRCLEILLDALASLGILRKNGNIYQTAPECISALKPDSPDSICHSLEHASKLWERWSGLTEIIRRGHPIHNQNADPAHTEMFIGSMLVGARSRAPEIVKYIDLAGVKRLLDLGGGPGTYAIEFAKKNPELKAVVFDLDDVTPITQRHIIQAGVCDRVSTIAGNYFHDDLGGPYDLIWISSVLHMHSPFQCQTLISKTAEFLNTGGRLYIREFILNEQGDGPPSAALFAINMVVNTEYGRCYKASEMRNWLELAGLQNIEVSLLGDDGLVWGRKLY